MQRIVFAPAPDAASTMPRRFSSKFRYTASSRGSSPATALSTNMDMPPHSAGRRPPEESLPAIAPISWPVRVERTNTLARITQRGGICER